MLLRYYQDECVDAIFNYFASGKTGNPLVALPTGTGKSIVIAKFCYDALKYYPTTRILNLTHVKELVSQNYKKLIGAWPQAPAGVYSAGLKRRDTTKQITFGGVQSVVHNIDLFGWIDVILIDEAHTVSPDEATRYMEVIAAVKRRNPKVKVIGLTATWWRNKLGSLINGGIFTDICYNRTKPEDFQRFIAEGYMSPLITPGRLTTQIDTSNVGMTGGEFNLKQLEAAVDQESITQQALRETIYHSTGRRAWLMFCTGIEHAKHVAEQLNAWGIPTGCVHSKMPADERDSQLRDWYSGKLRAMTNNNVLTTGIDYPAIDIIGVLRPTLSSLLWVQMLGRGMRPSVQTGKNNCLVLDFARNTLRLGPVDDPIIPGMPRPGGGGDMPVKICDECHCYNHTSVKFCAVCGAEFPSAETLVNKASEAPLMSAPMPQIETFKVNSVNYTDWISKKTDNRSLRVTYICGIRAFHEYISFEGAPLVRHKAHQWWHQRHHMDPPESVEQALQMTSELRWPKAIRVWINTKYPTIVAHVWDDIQ